MKEISPADLRALLEAHPEWWLYLYDDKRFTYNQRRQRLEWKGWDFYNDTDGYEYIWLADDAFGKDGRWVRVTLDGTKVMFWSKRDWANRRRGNPLYTLNVVTPVDAEEKFALRNATNESDGGS